jgi:hypothetical protein
VIDAAALEVDENQIGEDRHRALSEDLRVLGGYYCHFSEHTWTREEIKGLADLCD